MNFTYSESLLIWVLLDVIKMMFQPAEQGISRDPTSDEAPLITKSKSKSQNLLLKGDKEPLPETIRIRPPESNRK